MSLQLAKILSIIMSPLSLLFATVVLVGITDTDPDSVLKGILTLVVGFLVPGILYIYDYYGSSDHNPTPFRDERHLMYLGAVLGFALMSVVFAVELVQSELWFNFSMVFAVFFAAYYLVNRYFDKASLHLGVFGFCLIVLMAHVSSFFVVGFLLAPAMILSRIRMRKHEWIEIMWGWTIGLSAGLITWFI